MSAAAPIGRHRGPQTQRASPAPPPTASASSPADIRTFLDTHSLSQYLPSFTANEIDISMLPTLTSAELRDDLGVTNLRHRRLLQHAIADYAAAHAPPQPDPLPEHGRILDHLSNVRTYHSWLRVGVQLLAFAVVTLRLAPAFRDSPVVSAAAFYYAALGLLAFLYGVYRYRAVVRMIEHSEASTPTFRPDRAGIISMLVLVLIASVFSIVLIGLRIPP